MSDKPVPTISLESGVLHIFAFGIILGAGLSAGFFSFVAFVGIAKKAGAFAMSWL